MNYLCIVCLFFSASLVYGELNFSLFPHQLDAEELQAAADNIKKILKGTDYELVKANHGQCQQLGGTIFRINADLKYSNGEIQTCDVLTYPKGDGSTVVELRYPDKTITWDQKELNDSAKTEIANQIKFALLKLAQQRLKQFKLVWIISGIKHTNIGNYYRIRADLQDENEHVQVCDIILWLKDENERSVKLSCPDNKKFDWKYTSSSCIHCKISLQGEELQAIENHIRKSLEILGTPKYELNDINSSYMQNELGNTYYYLNVNLWSEDQIKTCDMRISYIRRLKCVLKFKIFCPAETTQQWTYTRDCEDA